MVRGINQFRAYFKDFTDQFALIGGTACDLIMEEAGIVFRATKDIDIVLIVEMLNASFIDVFWKFIQDGKYEVQQKESGEKQFYRFKNPGNKEYPYMLELFSRIPDALDPPEEGSRFTPIPIEEAVSSLSAILMDLPYYEFLHDGVRLIDEIPIVGPEYLIPLKAKAWMDLKKRKKSDLQISRKKVSRHKNDLFRLFQVIEPGKKIQIPPEVKRDMSIFLKEMLDEPDNLEALGIRSLSMKDVLSQLYRIYVKD